MSIYPTVIFLIIIMALVVILILCLPNRRKNTPLECRLCASSRRNNASGYCGLHFKLESDNRADAHARILKRDIDSMVEGGDDE